MPGTRLSDNSVVQLTLGVHLALLMLLAAAHRFALSNGWYADYYEATSIRFTTGICGGVFIAQIGLIAGWAAFSRGSSAVRAFGLLLFVPLVAAVQSQVFSETKLFVWWYTSLDDYRMRYAIWVAELSLWAIAMCAIGLGLRCSGLGLIAVDAPNTDQRFLQFRLVDIASWIVVIGMALAAGRWLNGYGWLGRGIEAANWAMEGNFWMQGEFAALALLIAAGILCFRSPRIGLAIMMLVPLALSVFNESVRRSGRPNGLSVIDVLSYFFSQDVTAVMFLIFAAVFGGTLLVVRDRGYRLVWRRPWSSPPVAESP